MKLEQQQKAVYKQKRILKKREEKQKRKSEGDLKMVFKISKFGHNVGRPTEDSCFNIKAQLNK